MKRFLLAIFICLIASPAGAYLHPGSSAAPVSCPQGGGANDVGCSTSPGGTFQIANFFSVYTGTDYSAHRPPYNAVAVDYAAGVPAVTNAAYTPPSESAAVGTGSCGFSTLQDPATATHSGSSDNPGCGIIPQHCTVTPTTIYGTLNYEAWVCTGTSNIIVIKGFELGAVGGHGSSGINTTTSVTGGVVVAYCDWPADAATYANFGMFGTATNSTEPIYIFANTINGNWVSQFSAVANGTATQSGGVVTVVSCTNCNFAVGMTFSGTGFPLNSRIVGQITGTGGATCPDVTCNGGIGTYEVNAGGTVGSPGTVHGEFNFGNVFQFNTQGDIIFEYNAITQVNGRIGTHQQRGGGASNTLVNNIDNLYNYVESGPYTATGVHFEINEYILQNGSVPMTWDTVNNSGNTVYYPSIMIPNNITSTFFINTGAITGGTSTGYTLTYNHVIENNNTIVGSTTTASTPILGDAAAYQIGSWVSNTNYVANPTGGYVACNGAPSIFGTNTPGGVSSLMESFFGGTEVANSHVLTAAINLPGANSPLTNGWHIWESGGYVNNQINTTMAGAAFTGTISLTALTTSGLTGTLKAGDKITGTGVSANTFIVSGSGSSWVVTVSQTVGPVAMSTSNAAQFTASASGTTLTITPGSIIGTVAAGQQFDAASGLPANTSIVSGSGNSWVLSASVGTIASTTMNTGAGGFSGTYSVTDSASFSNHNMRAAPDVILSATATGNVEMSTGAALTLPQTIFSGTNASTCMYPGFVQNMTAPRFIALNDNVKDADIWRRTG